jgi:hypothetical protein
LFIPRRLRNRLGPATFERKAARRDGASSLARERNGLEFVSL